MLFLALSESSFTTTLRSLGADCKAPEDEYMQA